MSSQLGSAGSVWPEARVTWQGRRELRDSDGGCLQAQAVCPAASVLQRHIACYRHFLHVQGSELSLQSSVRLRR